jgi:ribosome maturation factor RimP
MNDSRRGLLPTPLFLREVKMLANDDWGNPVAERVADIARPILTDLELDLYDCEFGGGTLRVTAHKQGGASLDTIHLATRLISRELDHLDLIPGHYTLEVSSPGLERSLRRPSHFAQSIGVVINVRLTGAGGDERRVRGVLVAADEDTITVRAEDGDLAERTVRYDQIDRAKTVFEWGAPAKPTKGPRPKSRVTSASTTSTATEVGAS